MQDLRALANTNNLHSYRAWEREGYRRSGFLAAVTVVPLLVVAFTSALTLFEPAARDARAFVMLAGGAFAVLLVVMAGSMTFAVLRLNAWKRAHPWSPPSPARRVR